MNRKMCTLCVSEFSPECTELLQELSEPHNMLAMSGTSVVYIDTPEDKKLYSDELGLTEVPALITWVRGEIPRKHVGANKIRAWYTALFDSAKWLLKESNVYFDSASQQLEQVTSEND